MPMQAGNGEVYGGAGRVGYLEKTAPECLAGHAHSHEPEGAVVCVNVCVTVFAAAGHTLPPIIRRYDR